MRFATLLIFLAAAGTTPIAKAGKIVANHDEWPTPNSRLSSAALGPASTYLLNLAGFFADGPGNFLVYSNNFGYDSEFYDTLTDAGHSVTYNNSLLFTATNLAAFDAVFLGGFADGYNTTEAINYVNAGGGVYIAGGTAIGFWAADEAAFWNPLLNHFGLQYASFYNGIEEMQPVSGGHPILSGVNQLYYLSGNSVGLFGDNPSASIILTHTGGQGLIGVYDDSPSAIPEPASIALMTGGLTAFLVSRRRAKVSAR